MADKCLRDCGTTEPEAINICCACYNEQAVKAAKAHRAFSTINYLAASKFPGRTNEEVLYEIQMLAFEMLKFIEEPVEIEEPKEIPIKGADELL